MNQKGISETMCYWPVWECTNYTKHFKHLVISCRRIWGCSPAVFSRCPNKALLPRSPQGVLRKEPRETLGPSWGHVRWYFRCELFPMELRASPQVTQYLLVLKERGFVFFHLCKKSFSPYVYLIFHPVTLSVSVYFVSPENNLFPLFLLYFCPPLFFFPLGMLLILAWCCHGKEVVFRKIFVRKKAPMPGFIHCRW